MAEMPDSIRKQLNADGLQLDDYVKDRASAMAYFRDKKIASIAKSTIQERC